MTDGATPTPALPRKGGGSPRELSAALAAHGLILRGGFHPSRGEAGLDGRRHSRPRRQCWRSDVGGVRAAIDGERTRSIAGRSASSIRSPKRSMRARSIPSTPDMPPFQRWALRAEAVYASPLGILIHPEYGLWHAYRAALLFTERLALPERPTRAEPLRELRGKAVPFRLSSRRVQRQRLRRGGLRRAHRQAGGELHLGWLPRKERLPGRSGMALPASSDRVPHGGVRALSRAPSSCARLNRFRSGQRPDSRGADAGRYSPCALSHSCISAISLSCAAMI